MAKCVWMAYTLIYVACAHTYVERYKTSMPFIPSQYLFKLISPLDFFLFVSFTFAHPVLCFYAARV